MADGNTDRTVASAAGTEGAPGVQGTPGLPRVPTTLRERIAFLLRAGALPRLRPCSLDLGEGDTALLRRALREADGEALEGLAATTGRETVRAQALAACGDVDGLLDLRRTARRRAAQLVAGKSLRLLDPAGSRRALDLAIQRVQERLRRP